METYTIEINPENPDAIRFTHLNENGDLDGMVVLTAAEWRELGSPFTVEVTYTAPKES